MHRPVSRQAVLHLGDSLLRRALLRHGPAAHDRTPLLVRRDAVFDGVRDTGFRALLCQLRFAAVLMQERAKEQGVRHGLRVRSFLGQRDCLVQPAQRSVGIAEEP